MQQPVTIDVDVTTLPPADRALIAQSLDAQGNVVGAYMESYSGKLDRRTATDCYGKLVNPKALVIASTPRVEDLLVAIRADYAEVADEMTAYVAREIAKARKISEDTASVLAARRTKTIKVNYTQDGIETSWIAVSDVPKIVADWPYPADDLIVMSPDAVLWQTQLGIDNALARDAAIQAETDRRDRAASDKAQWIARHGSRKLQRMTAEGIECAATYEREYRRWDDAQFAARLDAEMPGWTVVEPASVDRDVKDVPESALAVLDSARVVAPSARLGKMAGRYVAIVEFAGRLIFWPRD